MTPLEKLLAKLPDAKKTAKGWSAKCPGHDDRRASLSVSQGDNGGAVLHCHVGCKPAAVAAALDLTLADLMPPKTKPAKGIAPGKPKGTGKPRIVATYDYRDEAGELLFQVVRHDPKDFRQRRPKPGGGWDWSVKGVRAVPYRLPELLAELARPVVVVEGEKDVDNLARIGVLATCNAGGAGKWTAEHAQFLRGRHNIVLPDNDGSGQNHTQQVALTLQGLAASVRIVELPGLPPKDDVSDWIAAGGTKDQLERLIQAAPAWMPAAVVQRWPEIQSFDELDLPDFPTHALPGALPKGSSTASNNCLNRSCSSGRWKRIWPSGWPTWIAAWPISWPVSI